MRPGMDYYGMISEYCSKCPLYGKKCRAALPQKRFSTEEAVWVGTQIGVDFDKYGVEQFRMGMDVELEHGKRDPQTNVTDDDPITTGKIALAHLKEFPDYYYRLSKMEKEADLYWGKNPE